MIGVANVVLIISTAQANQPYWQYYNSGNRHSIWALPYVLNGDYACAFIGYDYQPGIVYNYMLNVQANNSVKNGIQAWGNGAGTVGVFGGNNMGVGVQGWDYYGDGVVGKSGNGSGSASGVGGRFMHLTPTATALQVDQGNVIFNNGKTVISNSIGNYDPLLSATFTGTASVDKIGVLGRVNSVPYYGIGGQFEGGYVGAIARSDGIGPGMRYGIICSAENGTYGNHAIEASVFTNSGNDWAGYFNGRVYSTGGYQPSDEKLKKDASILEGSLEKIMKLKPIAFYFKTDAYDRLGLPLEKQNGFIAQDVETIFPELVCETAISQYQEKKTANPSNEAEKIKAVNYTALIPILTHAIQEQQQIIEEMRRQISDFKNMR